MRGAGGPLAQALAAAEEERRALSEELDRARAATAAAEASARAPGSGAGPVRRAAAGRGVCPRRAPPDRVGAGARRGVLPAGGAASAGLGRARRGGAVGARGAGRGGPGPRRGAVARERPGSARPGAGHAPGGRRGAPPRAPARRHGAGAGGGRGAGVRRCAEDAGAPGRAGRRPRRAPGEPLPLVRPRPGIAGPSQRRGAAHAGGAGAAGWTCAASARTRRCARWSPSSIRHSATATRVCWCSMATGPAR